MLGSRLCPGGGPPAVRLGRFCSKQSPRHGLAHFEGRRLMVWRGMIGATLAAATIAALATASPIDDALGELNQHSSVMVTAERASYRIVFDAYLEMSEPPMPMLTTLRIGWPVWPRHSPDWTRRAKSAILRRTAVTLGITSSPSTRIG